jgi:cell division protein FtsB
MNISNGDKMVINKDSLLLYEQYNISIPESTLIKLEDGIRKNKEMLLTIAASHYGFRNRNWTIYRHDTIKDDITTYVAPKPKPIIQQHRPKDSQVFGHVIAADYKLTSFYNDFAKNHKLEGLTTDEYIELMEDTILPYQRSNPNFDGLAYLELVGKLTDKVGIQKVLDREFLTVSIGAAPNKLVCSVCGQDQTVKMCSHYGKRNNDIFMLAESLDYKELSFVSKPADPFGKIIRIHDEQEFEQRFELEDSAMGAILDAIPLKDFFEMTDKTIVCVDNICTIINREEEEMKKSISYLSEFGTEVISAKVKELGDEVVLSDADLGELSDRQFAIIQKCEDGTVNRRFPLNDEVNVMLAMHLLCDASDLSPTEMEKAKASITKSAKKLGIECDIKDKVVSDTEDSSVQSEDQTQDVKDDAAQSCEDEMKELCNKIVDKIKAYGEEYFTEDGALKDAESKEPEKPSPLAVLFSIISSFAYEVKYAGSMLEGSINSYLNELGKESIKKTVKDALEEDSKRLQDSVKELEEEIQLLTDQNMTLNRQLRDHFIDEILAHKSALGTISDGETKENSQYSKLSYEALNVILNDFRSMRIKIADSTVNNKASITKVQDPTQIVDSVVEPNVEANNSPNKQPQKITIADAVEIINSLKTKHGFQ